MDNISQINIAYKQNRGGGRVGSTNLRHSLEQSADFDGLEVGVNRYDLLLLVKKVGKSAGFSQRMIGLLDYYMAYTRDIDWEEGSQPIIYQSVSRTALDLGVSERQIQRLEQALFEAGALTWNDSGNHRRYGQRCKKTGHIIYAYGVDLTPLAYLQAELQDKLHEKKLYDDAWMETKRQISWYRRQIKASIAECEETEALNRLEIMDFNAQYDAIATQIRTHIPLESLRTLLEVHKALHGDILNGLPSYQAKEDAIEENSKKEQEAKLQTKKMSSKSDKRVSCYKYTTQESFNKLNTSSHTDICLSKKRSQILEDKNDGVGDVDSSEEAEGNLLLKAGLQHITWKQVLNAASERYRAYLPLEPRQMNWNDIVDAAYKVRADLHISQKNWVDACGVLGRAGASICVLLTDQAALREDNPVRVPAAYFKGMINKANSGELRLHKSIFGILKADVPQDNQVLQQ